MQVHRVWATSSSLIVAEGTFQVRAAVASRFRELTLPMFISDDLVHRHAGVRELGALRYKLKLRPTQGGIHLEAHLLVPKILPLVEIILLAVVLDHSCPSTPGGGNKRRTKAARRRTGGTYHAVAEGIGVCLGIYEVVVV